MYNFTLAKINSLKMEEDNSFQWKMNRGGDWVRDLENKELLLEKGSFQWSPERSQ